jgi:hypothetical protein
LENLRKGAKRRAFRRIRALQEIPQSASNSQWQSRRRKPTQLAQFRLAHAPLNQYLKRIGRVDSARCPAYGDEGSEETAEHFLLRCSAYAHEAPAASKLRKPMTMETVVKKYGADEGNSQILHKSNESLQTAEHGGPVIPRIHHHHHHHHPPSRPQYFPLVTTKRAPDLGKALSHKPSDKTIHGRSLANANSTTSPPEGRRSRRTQRPP